MDALTLWTALVVACETQEEWVGLIDLAARAFGPEAIVEAMRHMAALTTATERITAESVVAGAESITMDATYGGGAF